jgi:hypothetical protein
MTPILKGGDIMKTKVVAALFLAMLFTSCAATSGKPYSGIITAYYWDNAWVKLASWTSVSVGKNLRIDIDAWNWQPEYSQLSVSFDNLIATGELLSSGTFSDDFNNGIINDSIWNKTASEGATVKEESGVLKISIPSGTTSGGNNQVGGVQSRSYVIQGGFDVQVDFVVSLEYHNTPNTNAKLFLTDVDGNSLEISIRNGQYQAREVLPSSNSLMAYAVTNPHFSHPCCCGCPTVSYLPSLFGFRWLNGDLWRLAKRCLS